MAVAGALLRDSGGVCEDSAEVQRRPSLNALQGSNQQSVRGLDKGLHDQLGCQGKAW